MTLSGLFQLLRDVLNDHHHLSSATSFDDDAHHPYVDTLVRAERMCTAQGNVGKNSTSTVWEDALPQTIVALFLLRQRLRTLGAGGEEDAVRAVDDVVSGR